MLRSKKIEGTNLVVYEPRLRDYLVAKSHPEEDYTYALMGQMVRDEGGTPLGFEGVKDLPLRIFDLLNPIVTELTGVSADPLTPSGGSSTD